MLGLSLNPIRASTGWVGIFGGRSELLGCRKPTQNLFSTSCERLARAGVSISEQTRHKCAMSPATAAARCGMDEPTQDDLFLDAVDAIVLAALGRIGDDPEARLNKQKSRRRGVLNRTTDTG